MKIAILADIHGNLPALDVVLNDITNNKCEHIFVLGDLVGYYHWPKEVIDKVMNLENCFTIRGNHEELLLRSCKDSEFAALCEKKYGSGLRVCQEMLSDEQMRWLEALPKSHEVTLDGLRFALFHGSEREIDEYLYPDACNIRIDRITKNKADYVFFGHTHYPVVFNRGNVVIANPGSIGQPRDVGSIASYFVLNTKNRALIPRRLPFDSEMVKNKSVEHSPDYSYLVEILKRNNPYADNQE